MRSARSSQGGYLLLDYFIGATVFLTALGAFLTATTTRIRGLGESERRIHAVHAAESTLASLRAGAVVASPFQVEGLQNGVCEVSMVDSEGLREVTVRVRWRGADQRKAAVQLHTVMP